MIYIGDVGNAQIDSKFWTIKNTVLLSPEYPVLWLVGSVMYNTLTYPEVGNTIVKIFKVAIIYWCLFTILDLTPARHKNDFRY